MRSRGADEAPALYGTVLIASNKILNRALRCEWIVMMPTLPSLVVPGAGTTSDDKFGIRTKLATKYWTGHLGASESSWCQLCRHWWYRGPVPPVTTKLASWQLSGFQRCVLVMQTYKECLQEYWTLFDAMPTNVNLFWSVLERIIIAVDAMTSRSNRSYIGGRASNYCYIARFSGSLF